MSLRTGLFMILFGQFTFTHGQSMIDAAEYDSLKGHGSLPAGPVIITGLDQPGGIPAPWLAHRGGGGDCGCWVAPDETYSVALPENDDGSSAQIQLPFSFSLFGSGQTAIYINTNGNISFEEPYPAYTASGFPSTQYIMVAPFWADVDIRDTLELAPDDFLNGQVLYKVTAHAVYVNWIEVGYFMRNMDKRNSFQLIITDGTDQVVPGGNNLSFCYGDMQWTTGDASDGIDGFEGVSATVGVNLGNGIEHSQVGRFSADSTHFNGPYMLNSGVNWLDSTHFYINVAGSSIPPIFGSTFNCDTVVVSMSADAGDRDAGLYALYVLPGATGELVSCTSVAPTLPNFVNIAEGPAPFLEITFPINADEATVGTHFITFTAVNDDPVPLTSTYVLQVEKTGDISTGNPGRVNASALQLSPNPAMDFANLSWSGAEQVLTVEMIASDGRLIMSLKPDRRQQNLILDLKSVPVGTYLVRAILADGMFITRMVKTGF